ncbi:MAG: C4-dicarboxylate ABC transporter substrate-binding protein, partial [Alphaproteobacteria bacterium]|nr:C4-dicarboxylate ABC transporter substrate-binding protein [Alphaproteobacteria bacterium]
GADAFMAGDVADFIFANGAGKVREADASVGGLRALGIDDPSDANLAAAREFWPTASFVKVAAGAAPGVLEDTTYIAFPQVVFTNADVPDEVVYQMTKAIYEQAAVMTETFAPMAAFNPADIMGDPGNAEYHPGALKFFAEAGLK